MKKKIYLVTICFTLISYSLIGQWRQTNDLYEKNVISIVVFHDKTGNTNLFAGTDYLSSAHVYRSTNNGLNWNEADSGLTTSVFSLAVSPSPDTMRSTGIFATTEEGVYLSNNNGSSWSKIDSGFIYNDARAIAFSSVKSKTRLFVGVDDYYNKSEIYVSSNYGKTWDPFNFGLTTGAFINVISTITDKEGTTYLLVGSNKGIYIINVDEIWWEGDFLTELSNNSINSIAVSGSNVFASTDQGVFHSSDCGLNWREINDGLQDSSGSTQYIIINTIAEYQDEMGKTYLFAGSSGQSPNVFLSTNNGASWFAVNSGFPLGVKVNAFVFSDGFIFAGVSGYEGTRQNGIWKCPISSMITSVEKNQNNILNHFELKQNYPNPFNPATKIKYQLASSGIVSLKVYDILGREVATLVNETKSAGNYEANFNAANLSSGIYLYKIQAGNFTESKKMILLK